MPEKRNGQFIIKNSIQKYKNPWIEVTEDQVIRPDGKPGIFGTVRVLDGVAILPLDEDGYVYLAEEFRYVLGFKDVGTVSGAPIVGEELIDTAKRELKEELGMEAQEWIDLGLVNPFTNIVKGFQKIFLARQLSFGKDNPEATENIKLVKVKLEEAVEMVMNSEITHGASCVLILKAARYLKK
ncbi:MAG: MutT/nudix family protein [Candidatus Moranbacteria bacterium GW2011_GWF2_36_839]|nr:MAG: MutT/nudix family protein [Candidatus Moranbacteria bacterium GW2011_GWF1_36_78]KKQ16300.1 MAG: MutT/nudix family protein [Candidatus Moranbacteria bacterium GW2011_GWF2_36_839]HAT74178.1 DNA mismatch repair protein MutT [Candidatus Moranbacteria bacterium]HBY10639.1 DNA mismatch repair protein MutT [Candidatus Moranbacteria bacterium]